MKKKMKNKKQSGSRGAVTVFLTLVLVPCIIFTCAFGDISRVALSKSQSTAAADLALYSLMAHYEQDLKDWYGLVASVQSLDDFYTETEQFFVGMLDANGVDGLASNSFRAYISRLRTGGDFADFLQVETENSTEVGPAPNGAMGKNPALIEDGIVEFMKYRGPVELAKRIYERFKKINVLGELSDADEDKPITDKKDEYAEAEGEMMDDLLNTYLALLQYQNNYNNNKDILSDTECAEVPEKLECIRDDLLKVTELITEYYAFTDGIMNITPNFPKFTSLPKLSSDGKSVSYGGKYYDFDTINAEEDEEDSTKYTIEEDDLEDILENYQTQITNVKNAVQAVVDAIGSIPSPDGSVDDNVNPAVYCMKIQSLVDTSQFTTIKNNANKLMATYAKILLAEKCTLPETVPPATSWDTKLTNAKNAIIEVYKNYLTYSDGTTMYESVLNQYAQRAPGIIDNVTNRLYQFESEYVKRFCTNESTCIVRIGEFFVLVREDLGELDTLLETQIKYIDTIIDGGSVNYKGENYRAKSLDKLKKSIIEAQKKRDAWGAEANKHDTDYAKNDQDEYYGTGDYAPEKNTSTNNLAAQLRSDGEVVVEELRTRLTNIRARLVSLQEGVEALKYGSTAVIELDRNTAIAEGKKVIPTSYTQIDPTLTNNKTAAAGYYKSLVKPLNGTICTYAPATAGKTGNEPDLDKDSPELYDFLKRNIPLDKLDAAKSAKKENEKERKEKEKQAKKDAEEAQGLDSGFLDDLGDNPPHPREGSSFGASTLLTGMVSAVELIIDCNFDEFRDQIYFVEYVMDMFSYSTYDNEGQYRISEKDLTLKDYDKSQKRFSDQSYSDKWKTYDITHFTENVSLTNRQINSTNNYSNLAEVEYILYGKETNEDNLKAAYANIFGIREALNLVSGFQIFYSTKTTTGRVLDSVAKGITAATSGLIPEVLTKCVFIGIMATLESVHDLNRLKAGVPVAIYKREEDQWFIKITADGIASVFDSGEFEEPVDPNGLFYSEYIYIFLLVAAQDNALYKSMLLRTGDLIEANMIKGGNEGYDLDKAICYFTLTSKLEVKPLLMDLPIVNAMDNVDPSSLRENTGWCQYEVDVVRGYS